MYKKTTKMIISAIIIILLLIVSFFLWIISLFSGHLLYYTLMILGTSVSLIGLLVTWINSSKRLFIVFLTILFIVFIIFGVNYLYTKYDESIPIVKEAKIIINDYLPFSINTKIAKLSTKSSLKLTDNLPKIDGATALYPLYSSFVAATYPERNYDPKNSEVLCSTTSKAYENLLNGLVDVIFCAEPSIEQIENAKSNNITLNMIPIGKEAFVFFVNDKNTVNNITSEDIIGIYSGRITNWKELGGKNTKIKVFQRPKNSGSQTILEKIMVNYALITPLTNEVIDGMGGIIEQTADYKNYENAIGYSFLYYTTTMVNNKSVKLLSINGIKPTKESIQNNSYQYTSHFYAITRNNPSKNTTKLINWILSDEGQSLVKKTGYVSIR